ncbi:hypothetical protein [Paracoccus sp. S3-43]|uniref:hypothetical protein n=1 Tax=Paracoccus sp. S3-43 TaxID=3030011 RepID=UPI0023B06297|nr:hypothetical protein [Paracoccus sp. S3-43]WEF25793.1 hypothetical protein PXD02_07765 [Paracoccus sp. S3-43]
MRGLQLFSAAVLAAAGLSPAQSDAAQLAVCASDIGLRIAYGQLADHGWVTQGWVSIGAGDCQVLSVTMGKPIDLRLLALRQDESGPVMTSRLPGTQDETEPTYMRDEEVVCGAQTDFESVGTIIFTMQSCPQGQERMVLPMRILVPANARYRLSL